MIANAVQNRSISSRRDGWRGHAAGRAETYLAWSALFGTCSGVALAMLANLEEWGGYCGRVAGALVTRYGMAEPDVRFFRFFAEPPPGFAAQAESVIAAGLAAGEDPREAVRAAVAFG